MLHANLRKEYMIHGENDERGIDNEDETKIKRREVEMMKKLKEEVSNRENCYNFH